MRLVLVVLHVALVGTQIWASSQYREDLEDNEFAEFEDFEEDEEESVPKETVDQQPQAQKGKKVADVQEIDVEVVEEEEEDEDAIVEDDDSEFDHFQDEEEFEGFDSERVGSSGKMDDKEAPKITITKVPLHFRTNWDSFYLEMLMIAGLVVYALNFFTGKSKNNKLANAWLSSHRTLLDENFSLVGDDGKIENENPGLMKDSENLYTLWCSGRTCCEGMLVELKFLKRQDLVAMIGQLMRPSSDQVHIRVDMNKEDMDTFVFCVATKKSALRLSKDMADLSVYCPERRSVEKFGLPSSFSLMYELLEVATSLLDSRIVAVINKYPDIVEYIHFSDQFSGPKQPEDSSLTKLPETKKVLMFGFNIPVKGKPIHEAMDQMRPLLQLVFYCIDKIKRFKVSKEAKTKAEKNRQRVEEAFMKTTHAARAEAAAVRREEKKRQEKERILLEDDPEKQRKWEDRELKRQMKKKAPKMKQLKVKAL